MSKSAGHSRTLSTASHVANFVSLLPAFSPQASEAAFLSTVRRRAAGRPLPPEARTPSLRAHALDLVAELWTALLDDCRTGIEIRECNDGREVRFLRFLRYVLAHDRSSVHATRARETGEAPEVVDIGSPLPTWLWVGKALRRHRNLLEPLRAWLQHDASEAAAADAPDELAESVWNWAVKCIGRLARQNIDYRALRRRLQGALDLDAELLALARRARLDQVQDVTADWYTVCGRFRYHLERVADKAPALLRAIAWLIRGNHLVPKSAPLSTLKFIFTGLEATPREWRRLLRDPARPVWRQYPRGLVEGARAAPELLVLWARLHRGMPIDQSLPIAMWETILRTCRGGPDQCARVLLSWPMRPELMRAGIERARAMMAAGRYREFLQDEWARVVAWAADYRSEGIHLRHRSWTRALRAAADAERSARAWARQCDDSPWESLVGVLEHGDLRARALVKPSDLVDEAIALRHCADSYVLACSSGEARLFRVEVAATGRHVATIALRRLPVLPPSTTWTFEQAKGFANQSPPRGTLELAGALVMEYRRREERTGVTEVG